jgi:flavorubredoxin
VVKSASGGQPNPNVQVEYGMKRGTSDNSYIVTGGTATALLDLGGAVHVGLPLTRIYS